MAVYAGFGWRAVCVLFAFFVGVYYSVPAFCAGHVLALAACSRAASVVAYAVWCAVKTPAIGVRVVNAFGPTVRVVCWAEAGCRA